MKKKILILLPLFLLMLVFSSKPAFAQSCQTHNVWGWAWSDNIGWISFSCKDRAGSSRDYGVDINETGLFSGYAWSDNIGWISFGDFDADGDIDADDKNIADSPCASDCKAVLDLETAEVIGWARALAGVPGVRHEYFYVPSINGFGFAGDHWRFQTFTVGAVGPNTDHTANYISLWIKRGDPGGIPSMPGNVIVEVYDVINGPFGTYPDTSSLLCGGSINGNNLSTTTAGWADIPLSSGCDLSAGTEYAFVVKVPGGDDFNYIKWYFPGGAESYPGGHDGYSNDSGATWQVLGGDKFFQVWEREPLREPFLGGWDGWIKLRGTVQSDGSPYGVWLDSSNYSSDGYSEFREWAWGGDDTEDEAVIGWISFNRLNCDTDGDGFSNGIGDCPAAGTPIRNYKVMTDIELNVSPSATDLQVARRTGQTNNCFASYPPIDFTWTFDDPGDFQSAYQIQIDNSGPGFPSPEIDTLKVVSSFNQYTPVLSFDTQYWWQLKVWDSADQSSDDWIPGGFFNTGLEWPRPDFTRCPFEPDISETIQFCSVFQTGICDQAAEPSCSNMTSPADNLTTCTAGCSSWAWDFGDGGTSNLQNPTHSYSSQGPYGVRLTVTDANGESCFRVHWVPANIPLPKWKEIPPF